MTNIIDFSCIDVPGTMGYFYAIAGALAATLVIFILAIVGSVALRSDKFQASDVFAGWGIISATMTLAAILFRAPLLYVSIILFVFSAVAAVRAMLKGYFRTPFVLALLFPGTFVAVCLNLIGLGVSSFDDFSHWVPNAAFIFEHDGLPSRALPSLHSMWPGYPYALPFLVYLSSHIAGRFIVAGGAMINFMLVCVFAWLLAETKTKNTTPSRSILIFSIALIFCVYFISGYPTSVGLSVSNQADIATMVLLGALGLMLFQLLSPQEDRDSKQVLWLTARIALTAVAFVLTKQVNIFLLILLIGGFSAVTVSKKNVRYYLGHLSIILIPSLVIRLVWSWYVVVDIAGNGFAILPPNAWRFSLLPSFANGAWREVGWKCLAFVPFFAETTLAAVAYFKYSKRDWTKFTIAVFLVQFGYLAFLSIVYVGSSFVEYEIRTAASLHRYILHTAFLDIAAFWLAIPDLLSGIRRRICTPGIVLPVSVRWIVMVMLLAVWPTVMIVDPDILAMKSSNTMCDLRALSHRLVIQLPDKIRVGTIFADDRGLMAQLVNYEFALEDLRSGRSSSVIWHIDHHMAYRKPGAKEVAAALNQYPETNVLFYNQNDLALLEANGIHDELNLGVLVLQNGKWGPFQSGAVQQ